MWSIRLKKEDQLNIIESPVIRIAIVTEGAEYARK
jgi:hypothetical protein